MARWNKPQYISLFKAILADAKIGGGIVISKTAWGIEGHNPSGQIDQAYRMLNALDMSAWKADIEGGRKDILGYVNMLRELGHSLGFGVKGPLKLTSVSQIKPLTGKRKGSPHRRKVTGSGAVVAFSGVFRVRKNSEWEAPLLKMKEKGAVAVTPVYNTYLEQNGKKEVKEGTVQRYLSCIGTKGYSDGPPKMFKRFLKVQV